MEMRMCYAPILPNLYISLYEIDGNALVMLWTHSKIMHCMLGCYIIYLQMLK